MGRYCAKCNRKLKRNEGGICDSCKVEMLVVQRKNNPVPKKDNVSQQRS